MAGVDGMTIFGKRGFLLGNQALKLRDRSKSPPKQTDTQMKTVNFTIRSLNGSAVQIRKMVKLIQAENLVIWINANGRNVSVEYTTELELEIIRDCAKLAQLKEFSR